MYKPRFLSLSDALHAVAQYLAKTDPGFYGDLDAALAAACKQLVHALYDGAVRSEGAFWEPTNDYELSSTLLPKRQLLNTALWSNEVRHTIRKDTDGTHSTLDAISISWDYDSLSFGDEWETEYIYYKIRIPLADIEREFLNSAIHAPQGLPVTQSDDLIAFDAATEPTYSNGAAGRRTSMHIIASEMRRRFEGREQLPSMTAEAEYLSLWLSNTHPLAAPAKPKSIKNKLGTLYRQLNAEIPK
jgi:hypothetical protein